MKILFLSRWFPYPMNNGSKIRIYNLLRGLSQHHEVTLLSFADQPWVSPETPEMAGAITRTLTEEKFDHCIIVGFELLFTT